MAIRVPLVLEIVDAVIHRLDPTATEVFDPPGTPTSGYDHIFREPVVFEDIGGGRKSSRQELPEIRVPCQVEALQFDELSQQFSGDTPNSNLVLVMHRRDLEALSLLDPVTKAPLIRVNDRIATIEKHNFPGVVVQPITGDGLFVFEVRPGSWGFGPDGHDLELAFLSDREKSI